MENAKFDLPHHGIHFIFHSTEGKVHDAAMLAESHLYDSLQTYAFSTTGQVMCIYEDPAYPIRVHLQASLQALSINPTNAGL